MAEKRVYALESRVLMGQLLDNHYVQAKKAKEEGRKVAWCIGQVDTNLVVAMDYQPVYPENHACLCGSRGVSTQHCEVAEAHDYSPDLCSYARNDLGTIFSGGTMSPVGGLPRPDLLLAATMCNTHLKWWEALARHFQVPLLVLDTPFLHPHLTAQETESIVDYTRDQLQEHIHALEGLTGRPFNYDRLQQAVDYTARAARLYGQVVLAGKHIPSPITAFDLFLHLGPLMTYRGFPQAVQYYEALLAEVEARKKQNFSAVGEEVYRLYWDNIPIWFKVGYLGRKFASHGACMVAALYPFAWLDAFGKLDPAQPLDSIARCQVFIFLNRAVDYRVDLLSQVVLDYKVDGLVMQMSRSCKPYITDQYTIMKEVERRTGRPGVIVEGDMVDTRLFAEAEVDGRLDSFLELLARRKG